MSVPADLTRPFVTLIVAKRAPYPTDLAWCVRVTERESINTYSYGKIMNICHGTLSSVYRRVLHHQYFTIDLVFETVP